MKRESKDTLWRLKTAGEWERGWFICSQFFFTEEKNICVDFS